MISTWRNACLTSSSIPYISKLAQLPWVLASKLTFQVRHASKGNENFLPTASLNAIGSWFPRFSVDIRNDRSSRTVRGLRNVVSAPWHWILLGLSSVGRSERVYIDSYFRAVCISSWLHTDSDAWSVPSWFESISLSDRELSCSALRVLSTGSS